MKLMQLHTIMLGVLQPRGNLANSRLTNHAA
ncbi:hypothetical protein ABIC90_003976 [Variovorax boronicumulans]